MPFVLHLLAHKQTDDCEDEAEDNSRRCLKKMCQTHLKFLLDPLVFALGQDADNISFLGRMLSTITTQVDVVQPSNGNIRFLAQQSYELLTSKIR